MLKQKIKMYKQTELQPILISIKLTNLKTKDNLKRRKLDIL